MERNLRLRESYEVQETRARGKAFASGPLVVRILKKPDRVQNRYAVVAGKRTGNAVERNRSKRLVRESLRAIHPRMNKGYDVVVIVRGVSDDLTSQQAVQDLLEMILQRSGTLPPGSALKSNFS